MKAVLMSIKPKWCEKIFSGEKTVEVRKTAPKPELPFKVYVYCTTSGMRLYGNKNYYATDMLKLLNGSAIKAFENSSGLYKWNGKVIGEFVCDRVNEIKPCFEYYADGYDIDDDYLSETCLTQGQLREYGNGKPLYGWHITKPKRYDTPKELGEFYTLGNCEKYDFCNQCKNFHRGQGWLDGSYYDEDCCLDNTRIPVTRAPQSWQYVEEVEE